MTDVNWELIIFIIVAGLIVFAGLGLFIGMRISGDKRRIRELESELSEAKKDMEVYRSQVNNHFKKTSELFGQMTDSYKAVYIHMAEGAQTLCTNDAAMLKPANVEFLKLDHEDTGPSPEAEIPKQKQTVSEPVQKTRPAGQAEIKEHEIPEQEQPLHTEETAPAAAQGSSIQKEQTEEPDRVEKAEDKTNDLQSNMGSETEDSPRAQ